MSFEHVAIAMNHTQATGAVRAVIIGIASHANEMGDAYPGMMKLAQYAGYKGWDAQPEDDTKEARAKAKAARDKARRSAIEATQKLEALGEITINTNGGGTRERPNHMRPNLYTVKLKCPPNCDHSAQHRLVAPEQITANVRAVIGLNSDPVDPVGYSPPPGPQPTPLVGYSPPELPANLQADQDTYSDLSLRDAPEEENTAEAHADRSGYDDWHPGQKIAQAIAQAAAVAAPAPVKRPDYSKPTAPIAKVPPAPHVPRYQPETPPALVPPRAPEIEAAIAAASLLECPEGFGNGKFKNHAFPQPLTGCWKCAREALDLAAPPLIDQEAPECQS